MFGLFPAELPKELWVVISIDNPTTYYKLLQTSKIFQLDTDVMKAKFIKKYVNNGEIYYKLPNGWLHSCNDQPALIWADGSQFWYVNGKQHRDIIDHRGGVTKPSAIWANGNQQWCINGKIHRGNDQPAVIHANSTQYWYINDKRHRDNDRPAIITISGSQYWYVDGKQHRDNDRPAVIKADGSQYWYINDKRHRDNDQPAVIHATGNQFWYINNKLTHTMRCDN